MRLRPKADQIVGRVVDVKFTAGGLKLPDTNISVTTFVRVDEVGDKVTRCKAGEVILHRRLSHVWLRDRTHFAVVADEDVLATVEDLDPQQIEIEGEKREAEPS